MGVGGGDAFHLHYHALSSANQSGKAKQPTQTTDQQIMTNNTHRTKREVYHMIFRKRKLFAKEQHHVLDCSLTSHPDKLLVQSLKNVINI